MPPAAPHPGSSTRPSPCLSHPSRHLLRRGIHRRRTQHRRRSHGRATAPRACARCESPAAPCACFRFVDYIDGDLGPTTSSGVLPRRIPPTRPHPGWPRCVRSPRAMPAPSSTGSPSTASSPWPRAAASGAFPRSSPTSTSTTTPHQTRPGQRRRPADRRPVRPQGRARPRYHRRDGSQCLLNSTVCCGRHRGG